MEYVAGLKTTPITSDLQVWEDITHLSHQNMYMQNQALSLWYTLQLHEY
jgi:hypothetical protein